MDSSHININDLIDDLILTIFTKTLFPNKAILLQYWVLVFQCIFFKGTKFNS